MRNFRYLVLFLIAILFLTSFVLAQSQEQNADICRQYFTIQPKSAIASDTLQGYPASNAIDQDLNTNWFGNPEESYPKWIQIDLGSIRCVNSADVSVFFRDTPINFQLQISDDGNSWNSLSDEVKINDGEDLASLKFNSKIGRYVRFLEISGKRNYGSLREISLDSSALRSADNNRISLLVSDKDNKNQLENVQANLKEKSQIIEARKTNLQGELSFSNLASKEHSLEIFCPTTKSTSNNFFFKTFSPLISYYLSFVKSTGYSVIDERPHSAENNYMENYSYVYCTYFNNSNNITCYNVMANQTKNNSNKTQENNSTENETNNTQPTENNSTENETNNTQPTENNISINEPPVVIDTNNQSLYCGEYSLESPLHAKASSTLSGYPASNAIDDDDKTYWFGSSEEKYPKWIQLDLGEKDCINQVDLTINQLDVPTNMKLQVSDDGKDWKDVSSEFSILDDSSSTILFTETQGRYIRVLEISGKRNYGSLSEIKINQAKINNKLSIVQTHDGIVDSVILPTLKVITKDISGENILSGVKVQIYNPDTNSASEDTTNSEGSATFINALSKQTQVYVYCPSS